MPNRLAFLIAGLLLPATLGAGTLVPAQEEEPAQGERPVLRAGSLTGELNVDGVLSEDAWAGAEAIESLTTVEPEEGGVPAGKTLVKVLANTKEVVFGVVCYDAEPAGIVTFSKARDSDLEEEDHILLVLDTFQDGRSGYAFAVNPSGARFDGLVVAQGEEVNPNWDAVWEARTSRNGEGWSAEIRIPIKSISFKNGSATWGFNVQRRVQRLQETSRWSEASRDYEVFQTSRAGVLSELPSFDLGLGLSIRPALVGDMNKPAADAERNYDGTPSLDVTKTLGSNALASLTVNTDFAETESDARQTNLTRFDLFFPEKRTFFLQGSDIFDFGLGLDSGSADPDAQVSLIPFFTRRIGLVEVDEGEQVEIPIDVGGKVNGRVGETNLGGLVVRTREDADLGVPAATMGVLRVKQNVLDESSVGMIATFGDPVGRTGSWMAGADFTYQTSEFKGEKNLLVGLWGLRNGRDDLEGDKWAYGGKIDFPNDLWDASLSYIRMGEAFDPSLGFVQRTGKILEGGAEYRPRPGGEIVRQLKFGVQSLLVADQKSRWESYLVTGKPFDVLLESGDSLEFTVEPQGERLIDPFEVEEDIVIAPGTYEWWRYNLVGALAEKRRISGELGWSFGGFYEGDLKTLEAKLVLKPSATFIAELGAELNDVDLPEGSFSQDVYSARIQLNISSDLQLSSLIQYDNQSRSLGTNTRLRWTFHPLGDLFVVYNHNAERALT
ncbi:MAG TPA: DUF5916 domain-containing protein, partial [Vicinamibacteria bacterium]|nr:DUF5916 domain-containing protein [Vicinamibacteria bacterium]